MNKYLILCVDDEPEVLNSVLQDLAPFEDDFVVEGAESVDEAKEVIKEMQQDGVKLALILCDHIMPDKTGIDFLIELNQQPSTQPTRKLLLTGQAGLEDTVTAINNAALDFYISKPWRGNELRATITQQLTDYVIQEDDNLLQWTAILDTERILTTMANKRTSFGE
ncbi:response regulator [Vibrio fortis]|uniref:Chemotaxis protein CheY n=1 Tax=Vibrio fortis TaxID=212667 RepID=A0A066UZZ3_9VIBR|nr:MULTISPECIES: response regulator [Vibrio]KAB0289942.1 response regulator [Vibrio fortis]KAB0303452.1 response regulator [Vibrio fortis]KDN29794.1 chemotaxis protein CheY [Vibrio fortis]QFT10085.1 Hydrogenase transcriptional regulatory protein hupR1 [Vibrio sp. THAF190c]